MLTVHLRPCGLMVETVEGPADADDAVAYMPGTGDCVLIQLEAAEGDAL